MINIKLDETSKAVLDDIKNRKVVLIRSLPGMGLNTFVYNLLFRYRNLSKDLVINFFPHESGNQIDKLLIDKVQLENAIPNGLLNSVSQIQSYLNLENKNLFVILNKLDFFDNPNKFLDYFDSFYRSSGKRISILISANLEVFKFISFEEFTRRCEQYIFTGFNSNFDEILDIICKQQKVKPVSKVRTLIKNYSSGHLGLIIALLKFYKTNKHLTNITNLIDDPEINRRLFQISESLKNSNYDFIQLIANQNYGQLENLGLTHKKEISPLILKYLSKQSDTQNILTKTESDILQILENNKNKYLNIDTILMLMGEQAFEKVSDWTIYKHINNIVKKLQSFNIKIENKRGKGYRLV